MYQITIISHLSIPRINVMQQMHFSSAPIIKQIADNHFFVDQLKITKNLIHFYETKYNQFPEKYYKH